MDQLDMILEHHGIMGMKWGKKNGPPYPLNSNQLSSEEKKKGGAERKEKSDKNKSGGGGSSYDSDIKQMTDDELSRRIRRLELEKRYREMVNDQSSRKKISTGAKILKNIGERTATDMGTQLSKYLAGKGINLVFRRIFNEDVVNPKHGQKG